MLSQHPCFNKDVHAKRGRMHLPVAPACNISCGFCDRKYSCVNESRPGVTAQVLSPAQACERAVQMASCYPALSVVGIAGPGDPLANPNETLTTLAMVREKLPHMLLCLSTNGLALPEHAAELARLGVDHLTVTVNAIDPAIGAKVYMAVREKGTHLTGLEAASCLLARQEAGIRVAAKLGMTVKVNTVVVPGINDSHVPAIAHAVKAWGAQMMNCIPLIPVAGTPLGNCGEPAPEAMRALRGQLESVLPQMWHCARCRADACGLLGSQGRLAC